MAEEYDYIVIGSGAAGSVVAARLAQAKIGSVCVLEAGDHDNRLFVKIPAGFVKNLPRPELMWQFKSVAGDNTAGRQVYLPQGKILGGSTSINGLIYNRGQAEDFDHWRSLGNEGWSYNDLLPLFRKSETRSGVESQYRGSHGPLRISDPDQAHPLCDAFIESVASATGASTSNDYNAASQTGAGYYQRFIFNGSRETTANRYLKPAAKNADVDIRTNSMVARLLIENGKAVGVEVQRAGVTEYVRARKEVLLCAGTVNSARILMHSGVGDGKLLQSLNVPVVKDLPGVGENFQDHYFVRLAASLKEDNGSLNTQSRGLKLGREVLRWVSGKPSILSWSPSIAYAFLSSEQFRGAHFDKLDDNTARPDLQFVFSHGSYRPGKVYELDKFPAVTCGFTQQRPESRGYVRIVSPDFHQQPEVQPNYLHADVDQRIAIKGLKMARHFLQKQPLNSLCKQEESPGNHIQSDDEILDYVRRTGNTGYHLVGTCMMGPADNPKTVVGADLKVHGVDALRVIDASIMPTVTSSNTCAASIMIGEKGSELVIQDANSTNRNAGA